jgi:hypothetical protein
MRSRLSTGRGNNNTAATGNTENNYSKGTDKAMLGTLRKTCWENEIFQIEKYGNVLHSISAAIAPLK